MGTPLPAKKATVQTFASNAAITPPTVRVTTRSPAAPNDDVFITANHGYGQWGPMILTAAASSCGSSPLRRGTKPRWISRSSTTRASPHWCGGRATSPHRRRLRHRRDLQLELSADRDRQRRQRLPGRSARHPADPAGAAFITAYSLVDADLSSVGGARDGSCRMRSSRRSTSRRVSSCSSGTLMGMSRSSDSHSTVPRRHRPWDYFHVNSISLDPWGDGNFLISSRNTWAGYEIDHNTGRPVAPGRQAVELQDGARHRDRLPARYALAARPHDHRLR